MANSFRAIALLLMTVLLVACSESEPLGLTKPLSETGVSFVDDVKPILDARCVACHACYDAPCQLKLTSYEGLTRGGSKEKVYDSKKLSEAPLSRLYFDAQSVADWRSKGFHSVLSQKAEPQSGGEQGAAEQQFSSLHAMLELKAKNPLPSHHEQLDVPLDDQGSWQCTSDQEEFNDYASDHPQRGMPYALPALEISEATALKQWLAAGAPNDIDYSLTTNEQAWVDDWESFLNQNSLKGKLVARYIYEHLFLANLYGDDAKPERYFKLVRSKTPPGEEIEVVATRRPYDHPGVERVYYRLRVNQETIVAKTHMPYLLGERKRQDWQEWFFNDAYQVSTLPGYAIETASNPFKTFAQLPAVARYKLMLSEANFTVLGFIKGPVCKGPTAVNVINEHFWVFFIDPDHEHGGDMNRYLSSVESMLDMPAEKEDTLDLFGAWDEYAEKEKAFLVERSKFIRQSLNDKGVLDVDLIWDGDGQNPNAALTIFRHFDNASVHQGLNGQAPKTAWVIDYPLLERIHYLLIAGFDVYGNISHQLLSRIYMDFLRMEGESLFLTFLQQEEREELRQYWYREADERIEEFMSLTDMDVQTDIAVESQANDIVQNDGARPELVLYREFSERIGSALNQQYALSSVADSELVKAFENLQGQVSSGFMFLPEVTFIQIVSTDEEQYFTLLRNTGHLNNTSVLFEEAYIEEDETTVSLVPGFIGPRPNALMRIPRDQFFAFAQQLRNMQSQEDYTKLAEAYAVRRTSANFWQRYDQFLHGFKRINPIDFGILDLNKLENR